MKQDRVILGVNSFLAGPHHDNGAFLFVGDRCVGISSERIDRVKHSSGLKYKCSSTGERVVYWYDRWMACVDYCLNAFGLRCEDVDTVIYLEWLPEYVRQAFPCATQVLWLYDHHLVHAMSAFYASGFTDAAILVIDGQGKRIEAGVDRMLVQSLYVGSQTDGVSRVREAGWQPGRRIGIGAMYEMVTRLIGCSSEWATMGLASYAQYRYPIGYPLLERDGYGFYAQSWLLKGIDEDLKFLPPETFAAQLRIDHRHLESENTPYGFSADLAGQLQDETEQAVMLLAQEAARETGMKRLCIAGGVGLNSVANQKILDLGIFEDVFIPPFADDSGLAFGCALYGRLRSESRPWMPSPGCFYFGRGYEEAEILGVLMTHQDCLRFHRSDNVAQEAAKLLFHGNIIGWFQGGSEIWPRALGNRSILADPRDVRIRDRVNGIKKREFWRPLAPSVLIDRVSEYFDIDILSVSHKYMLMVAPVKNAVLKVIPGVVHVDQTARIQVLSRAENTRFYDLIQAFCDLSWVPMILNTSFNSAGEPIVETPEDAVRMFLSSDLDRLVIGDYVIRKDSTFPEYAYKRPLLLTKHLYAAWSDEVASYENFLKTQ